MRLNAETTSTRKIAGFLASSLATCCIAGCRKAAAPQVALPLLSRSNSLSWRLTCCFLALKDVKNLKMQLLTFTKLFVNALIPKNY